MILWLLLFILVIVISFLLAIQSMKDYQEIPQLTGHEYELFLIRKPQAFNTQLLSSLHEDLLKSGLIFSFERLIKGQRSALVVFGPKKILEKYNPVLDLLELEDYTFSDPNQIAIWEVGMRNPRQVNLEGVKNYFKKFPLLSEHEQFWWQLLVAAKKDKAPTAKKSFQGQIRAVVLTNNTERRKLLTQTLQDLIPQSLIKLPKAYSNQQLLDFYQKRSLIKGEKNTFLGLDETLYLLRV